MITLYSAAAAHGLLEAFVTARTARIPRKLPPPVSRHESVFARPTVAVEFTGRPNYAVVQQSGPARSGGRVIYWVDLLSLGGGQSDHRRRAGPELPGKVTR